jgi:hypothetical protein
MCRARAALGDAAAASQCEQPRLLEPPRDLLDFALAPDEAADVPHALPPVFLLERRVDEVEVIRRALVLAIVVGLACARSHRPAPLPIVAATTDPRLTPAERGQLVRELAGQAYDHPDGSRYTYSRGTLDRWARAYREHGQDGLRPPLRADLGMVRRHPELLEEACQLPAIWRVTATPRTPSSARR